MTLSVNLSKTVIGIIPDLQGLGGPSSFHQKFIAGLDAQNIESTHDLTRSDLSAVLVIAGSRHLNLLRNVRNREIPIIQRLDGLNWVHRLRYTGVKHFLRSEVNNWILRTIRDSIANKIVYQSRFSKSWWETRFGSAKKPDCIIYNGVDLDLYAPLKEGNPFTAIKFLTVEGHLKNGLEMGLFNTARAIKVCRSGTDLPCEWSVAGEVPQPIRLAAEKIYGAKIDWLGVISRDEVRVAMQHSHIFFPAELNPACPNSVIEALACGLPVMGYDSGSLRELVGDHAGVIMPYGADIWKMQPATVSSDSMELKRLIHDYPLYHQAARKRAEEIFGLNTMVDAYLEELIH